MLSQSAHSKWERPDVNARGAKVVWRGRRSVRESSYFGLLPHKTMPHWLSVVIRSAGFLCLHATVLARGWAYVLSRRSGDPEGKDRNPEPRPVNLLRISEKLRACSVLHSWYLSRFSSRASRKKRAAPNCCCRRHKRSGGPTVPDSNRLGLQRGLIARRFRTMQAGTPPG